MRLFSILPRTSCAATRQAVSFRIFGGQALKFNKPFTTTTSLRQSEDKEEITSSASSSTKSPQKKAKTERTLTVYVLPTIAPSLVFHPKFLPTKSQLERTLIIFGYIIRKWRLSASDFLAQRWHKFGRECYAINDPLGKRMYEGVTKMLNRQCTDEYFFKMIPRETERIEIIYPSDLKIGNVKGQLADWIAAAPKYRTSMMAWLFSFPVTIYLSKQLLPILLFAPFAYQCFRIITSIRAHWGAMTFSRLAEDKKVMFVKSEEWSRAIEDAVKVVESSSPSTPQSTVESPRTSPTSQTQVQWRRTSPDLHDSVIEILEEKQHLPELTRTYRRARWESFWKNMQGRKLKEELGIREQGQR